MIDISDLMRRIENCYKTLLLKSSDSRLEEAFRYSTYVRVKLAVQESSKDPVLKSIYDKRRKNESQIPPENLNQLTEDGLLQTISVLDRVAKGITETSLGEAILEYQKMSAKCPIPESPWKLNAFYSTYFRQSK